MNEDINSHLWHIEDLKHSKDEKDILRCLAHYKAVWELTPRGDGPSAMQALRLSYENDIARPDWAWKYFQVVFDEAPLTQSVISYDNINDSIRNELLKIRKYRDNLNYIAWLKNAGVFTTCEFKNVDVLLTKYNEHWVNGGNKGTKENPF